MVTAIAPLLFSMNLFLASGPRPAGKKEGVTRELEEKACSGKLIVKDICSPVCDSVFSYVRGPEKEAAEVKRVFGGQCDSICQCVCDGICDAIF